MGLLTYVKAQASSLTASLVDFSLTLIAVKFLGWWYLAASIAATIAGGIINFYINRKWVFESKSKQVKTQIYRYVLVWLGNLIMVTTGVFVLTHFFNINYMFSKVTAAVLTGLSYNYIMQRQFIFTS